MRPQQRVYRITQKLLKYWEKYPDLRLGQIIVNAECKSGAKCNDLFFLEDEELEKGLDKLIKGDI